MAPNHPRQSLHLADTTSTSLSPAVQTLQHEIRGNIHQHHAREERSDDPTTLRILELAARGSENRSTGPRLTRRSEFAARESSARTFRYRGGDEDRRRRRGKRTPRRFGSTTESYSTSTGAGVGDGGTWTSGFSLVDAKMVSQGGRGRGRDGRGFEEGRIRSLPADRTPNAVRRVGGAATGEEDDDDDGDNEEEEEESWDLIATPPSPSTTSPARKTRGDEDSESPESLTPFQRSGNPSPTSRSMTVSPSPKDQNWLEHHLHHQGKNEENNDDDNGSPLSFPNKQEKHQHRFPVEQSIRTLNRKRSHNLSPASSSPSQHQQHQQQKQQKQDQMMIPHHEENHPHPPPSGSKRVSQPATSEVPPVVRRRGLLDEGIKRERRNYWENEIQNPGEVDSSGSSDGDGWGFVGDGGEDEWEMV